MSSDNVYEKLWKLQATVNKLVLDGKRKPETVIDVLQAIVNQSEEVDSMVHVDRSAKLVYPDWVTKVLYPELENIGPVEYDGTKLGQFLLPNQVTGIVTGNQIHEHLKQNKMLESCLGLGDLLAIKEKGIAFFRANFKGKAVFGWRSVVRGSSGRLYVPYLVERGGKVVLDWYWLDSVFSANNPALRFGK